MRPLCAIALVCAPMGAFADSLSAGDAIRPQARPAVWTVTPVAEPASQRLQVATASDLQPDPQPDPLTAAEVRRFRTAVAGCWNIGALSTQARALAITVGFSMTPQGKPLPDSFRLLGARTPPVPAETEAFATARRAVLRCAKDGYVLPADKFAHWEHIEMTFAPERTRD